MEKIVFINLTPHIIKEVNTGLEIPPSGTVARVSVTYTKVDEINGIPVFQRTYGDVVNLPDPTPNTIYIVSGMVNAVPEIANRNDVVSPGELVRDSEGKPIGCNGFSLK